MSDREHRERLRDVDPRLVAAVETIFPIMSILGHPMFVVEGVRSAARQQALWAQGRTAPGKVVTYCDGVERRSKHQVDPRTGKGSAVDCAFQEDPWGERHPWEVYGALVKHLGLKWGGGFSKLADRPHAEVV